MRSRFAGVSLDAPERWGDISDAGEDAVPTLARDDGVGALQFSIARYNGGQMPNIDSDVLRSLMSQFAVNQALPIEPREFKAPFLAGVSGMAQELDNLVVVWYVSDGQNLAFVTYCADELNDPFVRAEVNEADCIVASIEF